MRDLNVYESLAKLANWHHPQQGDITTLAKIEPKHKNWAEADNMLQPVGDLTASCK